MLLGFNNYDPVTATNGEEGLRIMANCREEDLPDLIICDIMMPIMDGYEFFQQISQNVLWTMIPFIFLTAKTAEEDVRLGKMLGADDYLMKPIKEEDLLASIQGKLVRRAKLQAVDIESQHLLRQLRQFSKPSLSGNDDLNTVLFWVKWDETFGPEVQQLHPPDHHPKKELNNISVQLYQSVVPIYGFQGLGKRQDVFIQVQNLGLTAHLLFDFFPDDQVRGGECLYMIALLAPKINYFESLLTLQVLQQMAEEVKMVKTVNLESYWDRCVDILQSPSLDRLANVG